MTHPELSGGAGGLAALSTSTGRRLLAPMLGLTALLVCLPGYSAEEAYEPPRTPGGKPDFQGLWTNASITTLQRNDRYDKLVLDPDEVAAVTAAHPQNVRQATDDNLQAGELLDGSDLGMGRGYNAFWIDPGSSFGVVKGEHRTSWITEPADGRIPYSEEGQQLRREFRAHFSSNDGPEGRSLGERCLIGFGGTGGPPMLNVLYNNNYQFVQTDDYLMILVEMNQDARIIPINGEHRPAELQQWLGDSVGWWEGDTLVVETRHLHPQQAGGAQVNLSDEGRVIERFTRYSDDQILYEFEVEDPVYYTQVWRGEMSFNTSDARLYEYACHEGNYGLPGILAGARRAEADAGQ
ncbi:MAG: hypothetical protein WD071_05440 [Pseudohongiella sp.]|uniref:hypothetical protein n=1 Tax=Pseudohongiella sp. TaxID=1979412 RepID=UPI0034A00643